MVETILPQSYRGYGRSTPQEHIGFEYRIDRRHRVLRRDHMFPNNFHPSKLQMRPDFFVCNSLHSHNLRAGLVSLAPGTYFDFPDFPNEHLLLHLSGTAEWGIANETFRPARGDQLFTPAFAPYRVSNVGDAPVWLLSAYARVDEWLGLDQAETAIGTECGAHRFLPLPASGAEHCADGWSEWTGLAASRNRTRIQRIAPGYGLPPQHRQAEQIIVALTGEIEWHVDGSDHTLAPEDFLYIPAMMPFSCCNRSGEPATLIIFDVELCGV